MLSALTIRLLFVGYALTVIAGCVVVGSAISVRLVPLFLLSEAFVAGVLYLVISASLRAERDDNARRANTTPEMRAAPEPSSARTLAA